MTDAARRWVGLVGFAVAVGATVATFALAPGVAGSPGLSREFSLNPGFFVVGAALLIASLVLVWLRPRNSVGWLLGASALLAALCEVGQVYGTRALVVPGSDLPAGALVLSWSAPLWVWSIFLPATLLLARYPGGRLPQGRLPRVVDRAVLLALGLLWLGYAGSPSSTSDEVTGVLPPFVLPPSARTALLYGSAAILVLGVLTVAGMTLRRLSRAEWPERPQIVLLLTASTLSVAGVFVLPWRLGGAFAFALLPLAVVVGVLRYRLLGIEVVVRRTLTYGALTGLVLLLFVAVAGGLAALVPTGPAPQLLAAAAVAVVLGPVRDRLQGAVDRLLYGQRSDPWNALTALGRQALRDDALEPVLAALGASLRLPGVEVRLLDGTTSSWGSTAGATSTVPLVFGEQRLGDLVAAARPGERALGAADLRLLTAVGPLLALVLRSTRLAAALQVEQGRVVQATADERSRLRRDLHDGLGPSLTGIGLGLEAIDGPAVPERQRAVVQRLRTEVAASLEEVRRIIDDLRPGALETSDLLTIVRARAAHLSATSPVQVTLVAPERLDVSTEVEAAALRIVEEALTNVLRHAGASACTVTIADGDGLHVEVTDNGVGFTSPRGDGVGLASMRARAALLGGSVDVYSPGTGTLLVARIPT